nr:MAG TPA: hypothetical protein [Caudoviricetes sp.]
MALIRGHTGRNPSVFLYFLKNFRVLGLEK